MSASLIVTPAESVVEAGTQINYAALVSGLLATVDGVKATWTGITGAYTTGAGALVDNSAPPNGFGVSGGVSNQTIPSGDGYVEFVANVPEANLNISYPAFGGRQFFAGLTTQSSGVVDLADVEWAINVAEVGVSIYEAGVLKRVARAARVNGVYRVAIESGSVVYRADGEVIYRSDVPPTYPLRLGAVFNNRGVDRIGGEPELSITLEAFDENGDPAGSWLGLLWTAPATRGRYQIRVYTADYVYGYAYADVLARFPDPFNSNLKAPNKFLPLVEEYNVNEQLYEDLSADYNLPVENPVYRWRLEYRNLTAEDAKILDDFYTTHKSKAYPFYFFDWRADDGLGILYDNARLTRYERDHRKIYSQSRILEITHRPR